jgi:hypothetical protein
MVLGASSFSYATYECAGFVGLPVHVETSYSKGSGVRRSPVLPEDEIWQNAQDVRKELPNSKVASSCIQAYRIADKLIQAKGDNKFLGSGGSIHCGIGNDFKFTENGIERIDKKTISAPNN